jgi:hypothetical protein
MEDGADTSEKESMSQLAARYKNLQRSWKMP